MVWTLQCELRNAKQRKWFQQRLTSSGTHTLSLTLARSSKRDATLAKVPSQAHAPSGELERPALETMATPLTQFRRRRRRRRLACSPISSSTISRHLPYHPRPAGLCSELARLPARATSTEPLLHPVAKLVIHQLALQRHHQDHLADCWLARACHTANPVGQTLVSCERVVPHRPLSSSDSWAPKSLCRSNQSSSRSPFLRTLLIG